ncbi:kinase-like domain, phloem protein 2-like protein, partial [Tanacetum coccineum]
MFIAEKGAYFKHRNLVSILGSSDTSKNLIIVYEHPSNESLADHLRSTRNMTYFTWVQRLNICIDIAHGLNYIHSNPKYHTKKIHRTISSSILLKENWAAVIDDPIYLRNNDTGLVSFVRRCFKDGTQSEILDLKLVGEAEKDFLSKGTDQYSLDTFSKIAYQCLGEDDYQLRPTTELVLNELKQALYLQ